jgi:hypothetical protein
MLELEVKTGIAVSPARTEGLNKLMIWLEIPRWIKGIENRCRRVT